MTTVTYRLPSYTIQAITSDGRAVPVDGYGRLNPIDAAQETLLRAMGGIPEQLISGFSATPSFTIAGTISCWGVTQNSGSSSSFTCINANFAVNANGTGAISLTSGTTGNMNNVNVGVTTPAIVKASDLRASFTDTTVGNTVYGSAGTNNSPRGRVGIAAAGSSFVVTSTLVTASSSVQAVITSNDGTATLKNVVPAAGSFTINLGAAATANCNVDFIVIN